MLDSLQQFTAHTDLVTLAFSNDGAGVFAARDIDKGQILLELRNDYFFDVESFHLHDDRALKETYLKSLPDEAELRSLYPHYHDKDLADDLKQMFSKSRLWKHSAARASDVCRDETKNRTIRIWKLTRAFMVGGRAVFLPVIDIVNHAARPNVSREVFDDKVVMRAVERIEAGQEIMSKFSDMDPLSIFLSHGFFDRPNRFLRYEISIEGMNLAFRLEDGSAKFEIGNETLRRPMRLAVVLALIDALSSDLAILRNSTLEPGWIRKFPDFARSFERAVGRTSKLVDSALTVLRSAKINLESQ